MIEKGYSMDLEQYFQKGDLIPAIVVEADNSEVLMLSLIHI